MKSPPILTSGLVLLTVWAWAYGFRAKVLPAWRAEREARAAGIDPEAAPLELDEANLLADDDGKSGQVDPRKLPGNRLLAEARQKLMRIRGIQAELRQRINDGEQTLTATGRYLQGTNLRLRLELDFENLPLNGSLTQVCDGQVLWTHRELDGESDLTRRDVRQLLTDLRRPKPGAGVASGRPVELALGGLPAILASLGDSWIFPTVDEKTLSGEQLFVLTGRWSKSARKNWPIGDVVPADLPDQVQVFLDRETLFPRRVQYRRRQSVGSVPTVTLDWSSVRLGAAIDPQQFEFVPPDGVIPTDVTNEYLKRLSTATEPPTDATATVHNTAENGAADRFASEKTR